jgi:hypothetical protein
MTGFTLAISMMATHKNFNSFISNIYDLVKNIVLVRLVAANIRKKMKNTSCFSQKKSQFPHLGVSIRRIATFLLSLPT